MKRESDWYYVQRAQLILRRYTMSSAACIVELIAGRSSGTL